MINENQKATFQWNFKAEYLYAYIAYQNTLN